MLLKLFTLLAFGAIGLLLAGPSVAASFDCSKAQSPLEHAICANPGLSRDDDALARAYATALGGLNTSAELALRNSQKAWLAYVDRACTPDGVPAHQPYSDVDEECLTMEFGERELLLEHSRMMDGLRFTFIDWYQTRLDSTALDLGPQGKVATNHTAYAQIDGTDDEALKFNAVVSASLLNDNGNDPPAGKDTFEELLVSTVDPTCITLTGTDYAINHGAPHGYYKLYYVHYLRREHRVLKAADIFSKAGWQDRLRKLVLAAVKVSLGDEFFNDGQLQVALRDSSIDPTRWDFPAQGLLVQFGQGEIASPVNGAVSVIIPWSLIEDELTPGIGIDVRDGV